MAGSDEVIGRSFSTQTIGVGESLTPAFDFRQTPATGILRFGLYDLSEGAFSADGWADTNTAVLRVDSGTALFDNVQLIRPLPEGSRVTITPAVAPDTGFCHVWESADDRRYKLYGSDTLDTPFAEWILLEDDNGIHIHWVAQPGISSKTPWTVHHTEGYKTTVFPRDTKTGWHRLGEF